MRNLVCQIFDMIEMKNGMDDDDDDDGILVSSWL